MNTTLIKLFFLLILFASQVLLSSHAQKTSNSIVLEDKKIVMCQDYTMSFLDKSGSTISSQKLGPKNAPGVTGSNPYNIFINNKILRASYPNQSNSDIAFNGAVFDRDTLDKDTVGVIFKKISSDGTTEILHLTRKGNAEKIFIVSTVFDAKSPRIMQIIGVCN
jgi:hypothetical protein